MKKIIAVFLAALLLVGAFQVAAVPVVYAEETNPIDEAPVPTEDPGFTLPGDAPVSGFIEFNYDCDYCGETHTGFIGMLIAMLHAVLNVFKLGQKAIQR